MGRAGKVSIIVPIYKVEKYIHRCLRSIIAQTYTDLEIILVNDGSPDNCGQIADDYQHEDSRIQVIHKQNGGLSDARNQGMRRATGEYTMFVDSDDWLEQDMIRTMITYMVTKEADVVQAAFYYAYEEKLLVDQRYFRTNDEAVILSKDQLMYELVANEKVKNFAWGKLYKTELIQDIPFEKGVLFEDVFWAHQVMHRVDTFVILHQPFYNYYQRADSIAATYTLRNLDMLKGLKERHLFVELYYPELIDLSYKLILTMHLIHYNLLWVNSKLDKEKLHRQKIALYVRTHYKELKKAAKGDGQLTVQLLLFLVSPYLNIGYLGLKKGLRQLKLLRLPAGLDQIEKGAAKEVDIK